MASYFRLLQSILIVSCVFAVVQCMDDIYDDTHVESPESLEEHECETNEVWMDCSSCEGQCGKKRKPCPRVCGPAKCHCPAHKGFRRNEEGECVKC